MSAVMGRKPLGSIRETRQRVMTPSLRESRARGLQRGISTVFFSPGAREMGMSRQSRVLAPVP